ncbi:hypothetical protein MSPP1_002641 [Malassezia sp. CBS 17886]|nr:hypothetical protein MSPP1_002641 [Malassezia sp. CBS 17886]
MASPKRRAGPSSARWAAAKRKRTGTDAPHASDRYRQIIASDTLETRVQNDTSPFPPTYTEHVSRRTVPGTEPLLYAPPGTLSYVSGDAHAGDAVPSLRAICLLRVATSFSTHILPTPGRLGSTPHATRAAPPCTRSDADYVPEEDGATAPRSSARTGPNGAPAAGASVSAPLSLQDALWWNETNQALLKVLPPPLVDPLFELLCVHAPAAITKEVLQRYFLPAAPTSSGAGIRVRTRIFFPASLPLFSQDSKVAALLLSTLSGAFAHTPAAAPLVAAVREVDLHGLTRLQNVSLVRLWSTPGHTPASAWRLQRVTLPGCLAVGDEAVRALVDAAGGTLRHLDLTMTGVTTQSVIMIGERCPQLRTLRVARCADFTEDTFPGAVSACVARCANETPPRIPFHHLDVVDVSHTGVGDIAVGGLLRLCGKQLRALDVGYTNVGETATLDVLSMGLGITDDAGHPTLEHLGLQGLCVHSAALVPFLARVFCSPRFRSVLLDDMVEYARRHQSSLQGRAGISGDTLHAVARLAAGLAAVPARAPAGAALRRTPARAPMGHVSLRGDKRRTSVPGHWALARHALPPYTPGDTLFLLLTHCERVDLGGLELRALDMDRVATADVCAVPQTHSLLLHATALKDDVAHALLPWTGVLQSLYLDDTAITPDALDALVDANPRLALLGLSQCRGIPVRERRNYFAAYAARRHA